MADADGATKFCDIEKVEAGLNELNPKPVRICLPFYPVLKVLNVLKVLPLCCLGEYGHFLWV